MLTLVVNQNEEYDVLCMRGTIYGNPFQLGRDGNRKEVIEKYRQYFYQTIKCPIFKQAILALKGKRIACCCKPKSCHLDVIADYLNSIVDKNPAMIYFMDDV